MAVNVKKNSKILGNILALDCSSSKSGITIIDTKGRILKALEYHFVTRSVKKVKTPFLEIKDFTENPQGDLVSKIEVTKLSKGPFTFISRSEILKNAILELIESFQVKYLFIEDYAYFSSSGKLADRIEMTGILKYLVTQSSKIEWVRVSPTTLKSYNCGAPNASKIDMQAALELNRGLHFDSFDVVDSTVLAFLSYEITPHLSECVEEGILRSSYKKFLKKSQ